MKLTKILYNKIKTSSIHGLSHAANATNKQIRIFWLLMSLTCLGSLLYFVTLRVVDYQAATVSASIDDSPVDGLEFPMVTFCSMNNMDTTDTFYTYYVLKEYLYEHFRHFMGKDKTGKFQMFLIDFMYYRVEIMKLKSSSSTNTSTSSFRSNYPERFYFYTKQVLFEKLTEPSYTFINYYNDPSLTEITCENSTKVEENWNTYLKNCAGSARQEYLYFKKNHICPVGQTGKTGNIFNKQEKCKYLSYGPMLEKELIYNDLTSSKTYFDLLCTEIVFSFIYDAWAVTDTLDRLGSYFQEIILDFPAENYLNSIQLELSGQVRNGLYFYKNLMSSRFGESHPDHPYLNFDNITFTSVLYSLKLYKQTFNDLQVRTSWMTDLTNLEKSSSSAKSPQQVLANLHTQDWYYFQKPLDEIRVDNASLDSLDPTRTNIITENFKITDQQTLFSSFSENSSILNFYYNGIKKDPIHNYFNKYYSPKSSNCVSSNSQLIQQTSGPNNGFYVALFLGNVDYNLEPIDWALNSLTGFEISIDIPSSTISDVTSDPVIFQAGKLTKIGLKKNVFEKSPEYRKCRTSKHTQLYPFSECKMQCFTRKMLLSACKCAPVFAIDYVRRVLDLHPDQFDFNLFNNSKECTFKQFLNQDCYNFIINFKNLTNSQIEKFCNCI